MITSTHQGGDRRERRGARAPFLRRGWQRARPPARPRRSPAGGVGTLRRHCWPPAHAVHLRFLGTNLYLGKLRVSRPKAIGMPRIAPKCTSEIAHRDWGRGKCARLGEATPAPTPKTRSSDTLPPTGSAGLATLRGPRLGRGWGGVARGQVTEAMEAQRSPENACPIACEKLHSPPGSFFLCLNLSISLIKANHLNPLIFSFLFCKVEQ